MFRRNDLRAQACEADEALEDDDDDDDELADVLLLLLLDVATEGVDNVSVGLYCTTVTKFSRYRTVRPKM